MATVAGVLTLASACTMQDQDAPPLTGPSEFAQSIDITVSPDVLPQDGASQSFITVTALNPSAQPLRSLTLRTETRVGGVPVDFGTLSARSVVTGNDGKATLVYTAPPAVASSASLVVDIVVTPVGTNYNNTSVRSAAIRLVSQGPVTPPTTGLTPNFTVSTPVIAGQPVLFTACGSPCTSSTSNPIVSYSWNFGDGDSDSGRTVDHDFEEPGTYSVRLTVTDSIGRSESTAQTLTVTPSALPTADFIFSPTSVRVGQTVNFNASASRPPAGGTIVKYTWDFGDGSPRVDTGSPVIGKSYATANTFNVTLIVTDNGGRTSLTKTSPVTIQP
jgi:PKD repeat protein